MGLRAVQRQLAALLMEESELRAFAASPAAFLRARRQRGNDARLLAALDANDLAYFASRRRIDRGVMLAADLPRTAGLLGARGLVPYFRANPYALEEWAAEATRFAGWASRQHEPAVLGDLARFEFAELRLMRREWKSTPPSRQPRRAAGLVLLALGHRVDGPSTGRRGPSFYALLRQPNDVTWFRYGKLEHALLRTADGRRGESAWLGQAAKMSGTTTTEAGAAARLLRNEALLAARQTGVRLRPSKAFVAGLNEAQA